MKTYSSKYVQVAVMILAFGISVAASADATPGADSEANNETANSQQQKIKPSEKRHKFQGHEGRRHAMAEHRMQSIDLNNDGRVDLSEYLSDAENRFKDLDADSDGFVTHEEARNRHKVLRKKHEEMRMKHKELRKKREEMRARHRQEMKSLHEESHNSKSENLEDVE